MKKRRLIIITAVLMALTIFSWGVMPGWANQPQDDKKSDRQKQWEIIIDTPTPPPDLSQRNEAWVEIQKAKVERDKLIEQMNDKSN